MKRFLFIAALLPLVCTVKVDHSHIGVPTRPEIMQFAGLNVPLVEVKTDSSEVLWLARCLYSESKRPREMYYMAWVIRNRVGTAYRGHKTYRDVVLDPFQFTAVRDYTALDYRTTLSSKIEQRAWHSALRIAHRVYEAEAYENPLPREARHFFSEISLDSLPHPVWAQGRVSLNVPGIEPHRLRIFAGI